MKSKLSIFLLLGIFIFSFTTVSADYEFDNKYTYNEETKTAIIENLWGLPIIGSVLATVTLTSPQDVRVAPGIDQLVGEFNFISYAENPSEAFGDIFLEDLKNGKAMTRGKQYKVKIYFNESVDDYETVCEEYDIINGTNQSTGTNCTEVEVGSHIEEKFEWIPIVNPHTELDQGKEYEIGIFVDVEAFDYGDWIPSLYGVQIEEWATWTSDLNVGLVAYYPMNETTGTVRDVSMTGHEGVVDNAFDFDGDKNEVDTNYAPNMNPSTQAYSVSTWVKSTDDAGSRAVWATSLGTNQRFYLRSDGATTDKWEFVSGTSTSLLSLSTITLDTWYHIVITTDGLGNAEMFVDGTSQGTVALSSYTTTGDLFLGNLEGTNSRFNGSIDETAFWTRELTQTEITSLATGKSYSQLTAGEKTNLVSYYSLDEIGSDPLDSHGSNDGELSGGTISPDNNDRGATGIIENATDFDGSTTYVDTNDNNAFDFVTTDDFTIQFWIYPTSWDASERIMSNDDGANGWQIIKQTSSGNTVQFWGNGGTVVTSTDTITLNDWNHILITSEAGSIKIYTNDDGTPYSGSTTISASSSDLWIGTDPSGPSNYLDGKLDEVAIYNRALTSTEISLLYNEGNGLLYGVSAVTVVTLNSPADDSIIGSSSITFNAISTGTNLTNTTIYGNWTGSWTANETITISGTENTTTWTKTLPDGNFIWNVESCENGGTCNFATANYSLTVDTTSPIFNLVNITTPIIYNYGDNISVDFNVTDPELDTCWYNYNATNSTFDCNSTEEIEVNITSVQGETNITFYANDTANNNASSEVSFEFDSIEPTITIINPTGIYNYGYDNITLDLNYSINDTNLDSCWYEYGSNQTQENINWGIYYRYSDNTTSASDGDFDTYLSYELTPNKYYVKKDGATQLTTPTTNPICNYSSDIEKVELDTNNSKYFCTKDKDGNWWLNQIVGYNLNIWTINQKGFSRGILNCSENTTFQQIEDINNLTVYANDTLGNINNELTTWDYSLFETEQEYDQERYVSQYNYLNATFKHSATSILNPKLVYNGTEYSTSLSVINSTHFMLLSEVTTYDNMTGQNKQFYWNVTLDGSEIQTRDLYQNISSINFSLCDAINNVTYLTLDFIDELTLASLNAIIRTSTFDYYIEDPVTTQTYTYHSGGANYSSYSFCFQDGGHNITIHTSIAYYAENYPERIYGGDILLSNETTNLTLNLLDDGNGLYATFSFIDSITKSTLSGVLVKIYEGVNLIIEKTTDDGGRVSEWLNPNILYEVVYSKSGYVSGSESHRPISQEAIPIELTFSAIVQEPSFINGLVTLIYPQEGELDNATVYDFGFYAQEGEEDIDEMRLTIYDEDGTEIGYSSRSSDGNLSISLNTYQNKTILIFYELDGEEGGYWSYYKKYYITILESSEYSLDQWGKSFEEYFPATERTSLTNLLWFILWFIMMISGFTFGYNGSYQTKEDLTRNQDVGSRGDVGMGLLFAWIITSLFCYFNLIPIPINAPVSWAGSGFVIWIKQWFLSVIFLFSLVPTIKEAISDVKRWATR